jgi:hypothetical protein
MDTDQGAYRAWQARDFVAAMENHGVVAIALT